MNFPYSSLQHTRTCLFVRGPRPNEQNVLQRCYRVRRVWCGPGLIIYSNKPTERIIKSTGVKGVYQYLAWPVHADGEVRLTFARTTVTVTVVAHTNQNQRHTTDRKPHQDTGAQKDWTVCRGLNSRYRLDCGGTDVRSVNWLYRGQDPVASEFDIIGRRTPYMATSSNSVVFILDIIRITKQ